MATQIASLYYPKRPWSSRTRPSALAPRVVRGRRVALVRAEFNATSGYCDVELSYGGRAGIGRAGSGPLIGGAEATLAALRDLGYDVPFYLLTVTASPLCAGGRSS